MLIVGCTSWRTPEEIERRYGAINDFEQTAGRRRHRRSSSACCTSPPTSSSERLLARLDDPTKQWKFKPERRRRARHAGTSTRRPTRSRSSAATPTRRPGTSSRATASGTATGPSRSCCWRRCGRMDLDWPEPGLRRGRAARAARAERPVSGRTSWQRRARPATSRRCARAGRCPGIVEADDLGTYVCKFRGAGQGLQRAGRRGDRRRAGPPARACRTPRAGRGRARRRRSRATRPTRRCRTCSAPASGSTSASTSCPARSASTRALDGRRRTRRRGSLWLDAFVANVDRSWRNPNLLVWHGDLWLIDHGAALYFHHAWSGGVADPPTASRRSRTTSSDHVLARSRRRGRGARRRAGRRGHRRRCSPRSSPRCPTSGWSRVPGAATPGRAARGVRRLPAARALDGARVAGSRSRGVTA